MFELDQLKIFITIVEEGTVSKAADTLLISQPALSRTIQKLEEELGVSLFDRTKNKIYLNETGKFAYKKAKHLLKLADGMQNELVTFDQNNFMTHLASCAPAPIWAIESIMNKNIKSMIIDNSHEMIEGLYNNTFSLIVLNHYIKNKDFECVKLFSEKLYLSVVPTHHLASKECISFHELNGESILLSSKIGFWSRLCQLNLPDSHLLYQEDEMLREIVESSTLPSFKTDITIKKIQSDNKRIYIPITDTEATTHYYLYYKKEHQKHYNGIKEGMKNVEWIKMNKD